MDNWLFPFKILFYFKYESRHIVEIKRTDIQSEDKSLVYKWLLIQKQHEKLSQLLPGENQHQISILTFQSMEQRDGIQIRTFAEGTLEWNRTTADFNGEQMTRIERDDLSTEVLELIAKSLGAS